ncbi:MAG: type II toxin-antitoxin system RelE/ParE family toxin [Cryomorphaceae bacterium]|nr:type II toxin-antitoxin system RelE/ParE family toxin [Flavobacteriales bacterium]
MTLEIEWTDTADEQLDRIIDHLEAKWTDKEIEHFFEQLEKGVETIATHHTRQKSPSEKFIPTNTKYLLILRSSTHLIQRKRQLVTRKVKIEWTLQAKESLEDICDLYKDKSPQGALPAKCRE